MDQCNADISNFRCFIIDSIKCNDDKDVMNADICRLEKYYQGQTLSILPEFGLNGVVDWNNNGTFTRDYNYKLKLKQNEIINNESIQNIENIDNINDNINDEDNNIINSINKNINNNNNNNDNNNDNADDNNNNIANNNINNIISQHNHIHNNNNDINNFMLYPESNDISDNNGSDSYDGLSEVSYITTFESVASDLSELERLHYGGYI